MKDPAALSPGRTRPGMASAPQTRHRRVPRVRHSYSSSVADPRSQNAAARSQTAIPALVIPCAQLSVGMEQQWPPGLEPVATYLEYLMTAITPARVFSAMSR
jgi:hypothetical protein